MRTILIIVLGLFIAQTIDAQGDSLIVKIDNYGQLIIVSHNLLTAKQKSYGLDSTYRNFYNDFKKIDKSKFGDKNQIIKYSIKEYETQYRTISIEELDNEADVFYFQDDKQQSMLPGKYKLELDFGRKVVIFVNSLDDFEKISQISLDSLYLQSLKNIQSQNLKKRMPYKIFYSSENNQIDKNSNLTWTGKSNDFILLAPSLGMTIIDSRFAPEWGASIEFEFRNKTYLGYKFGINYTTMYLYDKDDISDISSYGSLNLNYYLKYKNEWNQKFTLGYMVNKSGTDFKGNTWNAYYSINIKNIGFKLGGFYTKNVEGKYFAMPSIGFDFIF